MKIPGWRDGRLSWPLVIAIAYVAVSLVAADVTWRLVVMPFNTFALYVLAVMGSLGALAIALYVVFLRRRPD